MIVTVIVITNLYSVSLQKRRTGGTDMYQADCNVSFYSSA